MNEDVRSYLREQLAGRPRDTFFDGVPDAADDLSEYIQKHPHGNLGDDDD